MSIIKITTNWLIKFVITATMAQLITLVAQARDYEESRLLLQEAMMESNADYNKHKKKMNHEEFDRADDWGERNTQAIMIDGKKADLDPFQEMKDEVGQDREVSAHQHEQKLND